jgi:glutamyl-tRNA synthetase
VAEDQRLKLGKVAQPLRVAVSGGAVSPPIDITLELLGKDRTMARVERAIVHIRSGSHSA